MKELINIQSYEDDIAIIGKNFEVERQLLKGVVWALSLGGIVWASRDA